MKNPAAYSPGHFLLATSRAPLNSKIREVSSCKPTVILVILLSVSLLHLLQSQSCYAQAPQQFSFQGVARDAELINKKLSALEASVKELLAGQATTSTPSSK